MLEFKLEPVDCFISLFFGVPFLFIVYVLFIFILFISLFFGVPFLFIVVFLTEYFLSEVCAMYRMI